MAFVSLSDEDMTLYAGQMEQVKARLDAAIEFLQPPFVYPRVEAGLLQLRQAMEALVLSSLITNRRSVERVAGAFAKKNHDEVLKLVRAVNRAFWPEPSSQVHDDHGVVVSMDLVTTGFLTEAEYLPTWGRLSEWLHATNPFAAMRSPEAGAKFGLEVAQKLVTLLNHHSVRLSERNELLVCMMSEATTGRVHVFSFGSAAEGRTPNTNG
jgi:hypothetical protein